MKRLYSLMLLVLGGGLVLSIYLAIGITLLQWPKNSPVFYFEIDGMPCIETTRGISCDWSKWEGQDDEN